MGTGEVLVAGLPEALEHLPWPTRLRSGPTVRVLEAEPDDLTRIAQQAGFAMTRADEGFRTAGDPAVLDGLDDGARLFVEAWELRQDPRSTEPRPGDGLPWDAPGFDAP